MTLLLGCGGGTSNSGSGGSGSSPVNNTVSVQVNPGPANNYVNGLFVSVTVCEPGTSTCQTIPNVTLDTGSMGLRLLSSQVTLLLPGVNVSGNALQECVSFADGSYVWGPVVTADIQMAGEKASSVPVHIISATPSYPAPPECAGSGSDDNTVEILGANGILGIGNFRQDCGAACTSSSTSLPPMYFLCSGSTCTTTAVPLASQLQNPVWLFPQDNNGVLISLPAVPATGSPSVSGSLFFGIGTQSDNALGSAQVYTTDASGNFITTFKNVAYHQSYLDTGSNGFFFLDPSTVGIPTCSDNSSFYCPPSTVQYTATTTGLNGTSAQISFSVANADSLFSTHNWAFSNLGGPSPRVFDWGLPFFFGRNVFVGIEGQTSPAGVGPYWAY
jgi:hypothetical protein